jgi:hypothetical protein
MRQKARDMDQSTQERLKQILRPEQAERLPEPDRGNRDGGGDPRQRRRDQLNRT